MLVFSLVLSIIMSIFSTGVMSYLALAIPIGPWIAPTIVLITLLVLHCIKSAYKNTIISYVTIAGSVGGILATAFSFSFPTLYFLDASLFKEWLHNPFYFCVVLAGLAISAGSFGYLIANMLEKKLIDEEQLAFPIGQMVYKMINSQGQIQRAYELMVGFLGTGIFCILQNGFRTCVGIIPKTITLLRSHTISYFSFPVITLDLWPLLWSIGFVTGHVIAMPIAVGAVLRYIMVEPINRAFFANLSSIEFALAYCSGLVLYGTLHSFIGLPKTVIKLFDNIKKIYGKNGNQHEKNYFTQDVLSVLTVAVLNVLFLSYFSFTWYVQVYLFASTCFWTYQIALIGGKVGLAPLGRFATFVMVPAMLLFSIDIVQIVIIATYVEICGGVTVDILFGRKLAKLADLSSSQVRLYQLLGLCVSAACVGIIFWLLISHFDLGSTELFASKAQSRKLLISVHSFNYIVLGIGVLSALVLDYLKINAALVLTGILMPVNISLGLVIGGLSTLLTNDKERWYPFWSGVFVANSLWMIIRSLL